MSMRVVLMVAGCMIAAVGCSPAHQVRAEADTVDGHAGSDAAWARLDPDQDGFLTVAELEAQHGMALLRDLWNADADGDGRVSRQEWNRWWPHMSRTEPSPTMQALNASAAVPGSPERD